MKKAEYDEILKNLADPDQAAQALVDLATKLAADETEFTNLTNSVNTLRDTNAKLALRITAPVTEPKTEPEKDPYETFVAQLRENFGDGGENGKD